MSATQREHVIQVLDTPVFQGEIARGVPVPDYPADEAPLGWCAKAALCIVAALVVAFLVALITLCVLDVFPPDYSAAITGGAAAASPNAIPPLFNLTFHIKNPSRLSTYCVPSGTTAAVSYGGAAIGAGTVPTTFCAGEKEEGEVVVPVWAVGAGADDVTLRLALQRREAVVDVVIQMPRGRGYEYDGPRLASCSVRVGHGLSPCTPSDW